MLEKLNGEGCVRSNPNILLLTVVLLLAGVMSAQLNQTNPASDSQKAASAEPQARKVIHREMPVYPQEAKAKNISGTVVVEALIDKQGNVISARVVEGDKIFWDAALAAIKAWKFEPVTSPGQPIEKWGPVKITFCSKPGC